MMIVGSCGVAAVVAAVSAVAVSARACASFDSPLFTMVVWSLMVGLRHVVAIVMRLDGDFLTRAFSSIRKDAVRVFANRLAVEILGGRFMAASSIERCLLFTLDACLDGGP